MTSKRSGSKAKSGAGAKAGKRTTKKRSFKDLEPKDGQKIRGGLTFKPIVITKPIDSSTP